MFIVLSYSLLRKSSWLMTNLSLLAYLSVGLVCEDFRPRPEQYNSLSGCIGRMLLARLGPCFCDNFLARFCRFHTRELY